MLLLYSAVEILNHETHKYLSGKLVKNIKMKIITQRNSPSRKRR
jgi:hypothetical protein